MKGAQMLLATLDQLVNIMQYLQAESSQSSLFPFTFTVDMIRVIPSKNEFHYIAIYNVVFEFVDQYYCCIKSFRSAGTNFSTTQCDNLVEVVDFQSRSTVQKSNVGYDYSLKEEVICYSDESVYTTLERANGLKIIAETRSLRGTIVLDDSDLELSINPNEDRVILRVSGTTWKKYLRSIVPAGSGRFGYTRDGTE